MWQTISFLIILIRSAYPSPYPTAYLSCIPTSPHIGNFVGFKLINNWRSRNYSWGLQTPSCRCHSKHFDHLVDPTAGRRPIFKMLHILLVQLKSRPETDRLQVSNPKRNWAWNLIYELWILNIEYSILESEFPNQTLLISGPLGRAATDNGQSENKATLIQSTNNRSIRSCISQINYFYLNCGNRNLVHSSKNKRHIFVLFVDGHVCAEYRFAFRLWKRLSRCPIYCNSSTVHGLFNILTDLLFDLHSEIFCPIVGARFRTLIIAMTHHRRSLALFALRLKWQRGKPKQSSKDFKMQSDSR